MLLLLTRVRRFAFIAAGFLAWQAAGAQTLLPAPDLGLMVDGGVVNSVAVQADGKIVIGGIFSRVNGVVRNNIARLNADRTLDTTWNPNANGDVKVLAVSGNTVYAGGFFTTIGGQIRFLLAALDGTTGLATSWNPDPIADIRAIIPAGPIVYVGGLFTKIGGLTRNRIAALDATTGIPTAWDPNADNAVFALALSGTTIYAGGAFNNIGGQPRNAAAALSTTVNTGNALAFDPNFDNSVLQIAVSGGTVFASGSFQHVGGGPTPPLRPLLAAVDAANGALLPFNASPDGLIYGMSVSGGTLYIGGTFANVGMVPRRNIAAIDAATGTILAWNPDPNAGVQAVHASGGSVWAGGDFYRIGGAPAMQVAQLDAASGLQLAGFHPGAGTPGPTRSVFLQPDGKLLVGGGQFNWVGKAGVGRNNLLRLNADGSLDLAFDPATGTVQPSIFEFAVSGSNVYIAGGFTEMGGQPRNNLAAVDIVTGIATSWNPNAAGAVRSISLAGSTLYAGGDFLTMGALTRHYAAALDTTSGIANAWDPNADSPVQKVFAFGSTVYAGGFFANIGTQTRSRIAELDGTTGIATAWNPIGVGGSVLTFAPLGNTIYLGGNFTGIGGATQANAAALDKTTGLATGWNPNVLGPFGTQVTALLFSGSKLYAGGSFTGIGGASRNNLASLDPATGTATPWNPNADADVSGIAAGTSGVFGVGGFLTVLGQQRDGLAGVSLDVALPPALQVTKSRKAHGGAGAFDLTLSP
jgi:hypothetical protein